MFAQMEDAVKHINGIISICENKFLYYISQIFFLKIFHLKKIFFSL